MRQKQKQKQKQKRKQNMENPTNDKPNRAARRHPPKARTLRVKLPPGTQPQPLNIGGGNPAASLPEADEPEDEAPRPAREDRPPAGRKRGRPPRQTADDRIYSTLVQVYGGAGLLIYPFNAYDGQVITSKAEDCARGWLGVAHQHKEVYRVLEMLSSSNAYLLLLTSHLAIAMAVASNHHIVPTNWVRRMGMGGPPVPEDAPPQGPMMPPPHPADQMAQAVQTPNLTPEQWAMIQAQAHAAQPTNGYTEGDVAPRPEQNPAFLMDQLGRRE